MLLPQVRLAASIRSGVAGLGGGEEGGEGVGGAGGAAPRRRLSDGCARTFRQSKRH